MQNLRLSTAKGMINMDNFIYQIPTKVIFGKDTESLAGKEIKSLGASRVLLHYGGQSAKSSGLIDNVNASLKEAGLFHIELGGVLPNPRLSKVEEGVKLCRENSIDFILAVGGGSVIDSAKAISLGAAGDCPVWDFYERKQIPKKGIMHGAIPTIAAAGSETSNSAVITNEDGWIKKGLTTELNRPKFAIMNPKLTYSVPAYHTACGITDIMMHTMDRYFSHTKDTDFTDRVSEALLQSVIQAGKIVMKNPTDYAARADLMWAGSISHNGLTGLGKVTDFAPHQLEHELSGKYDVAHGAGLAAIWGHWARYVYKKNIMKFAQFAQRVFNVSMNFENPEATALEGIERTENYFRSIGMPVNLKELGIDPSPEDYHDMAEKCTYFGKRTIGGFQVLKYKDIKAIYQAARANAQ